MKVVLVDEAPKTTKEVNAYTALGWNEHGFSGSEKWVKELFPKGR